MVDGNQLLSPLAHLSLRSEELFGSDFVGSVVVRRDVAEPIDTRRNTDFTASDQTATFGRVGFASVRDDVKQMSLQKSDQGSVVTKLVSPIRRYATKYRLSQRSALKCRAKITSTLRVASLVLHNFQSQFFKLLRINLTRRVDH